MISLPSPSLFVAALVVAALVWLAHWAGRRSAGIELATLRGRHAAVQEQLNDRQRLDETLLPLQSAMSELTTQVQSAERARVGALSTLSEQLLSVGRQVQTATQGVEGQARRITEALAGTQSQGSWGEMQLHRLVEAAGMLEHVHFTEQVTLRSDDEILRPDMVVDIGSGRSVVVDSKVSLDAFLSADLDQHDRSAAHASAVADHVNRLSSKQYWKAAGTPEFVIMFLPAEHMLAVALQHRPELLQAAFDKKVVLATPTTLMAMLRSISWAWQQAEMADQAREVLDAGNLLYQRLTTANAHLGRVGKSLNDAVDTYNRYLGSLDSRVLPAARRLGRLTSPQSEPATVTQIDVRAREVSSEQ